MDLDLLLIIVGGGFAGCCAGFAFIAHDINQFFSELDGEA